MKRKDTEHKYRLKYDLKTEAGLFTSAEIKKNNLGGTDALIVISMVFSEDGSYSQMINSFDGRNDEMPVSDNDLFKVWILLAKRLGESQTLPTMKRAQANDTFESFQKIIASVKKIESGLSRGHEQ